MSVSKRKIRSLYLVRNSHEGAPADLSSADIKRLRVMMTKAELLDLKCFLGTISYSGFKAFTKDELECELDGHDEAIENNVEPEIYGAVCPMIRWDTLTEEDWETMPKWIQNREGHINRNRMISPY